LAELLREARVGQLSLQTIDFRRLPLDRRAGIGQAVVAH
jgi:hypothetical protein